MNETFVGNNLEETAYHEAGHVVVNQSALGLELRIRGITIYEVSSDVMDGLACYWDDDTYGENLQALLGGQIAQWRKFPETNLVDGKT